MKHLEAIKVFADNSPDIWIMFDQELDIIYLNEAVEKILGVDQGALMGKKASLFSGNSEKQLEKEICQAVARKDTRLQTRLSIHVNQNRNSTLYLRLAVSLYYQPDDSFQFGLLQAADVTDLLPEETRLVAENQSEHKRKKEASLSVSDSQVRQTLAQYKKADSELYHIIKQLEARSLSLNKIHKKRSLKTPALKQLSIIIEFNEEGLITYVNNKFLDISAYSFEKIVGQRSFLGEAGLVDRKVHKKAFAKNILNQLEKLLYWRGEISLAKSNGDPFWLLMTIIPVFNAEGKLENYFSFSNDITQQKLRENELVKSKIVMEKAALSKAEFLSVMSHEIRTPLNSVIGLTNLLKSRSPRTDQKAIIETLKKSSDNLLHLVNDVLDFNKIQNGKVEIDEVDFHLSEVLEQLGASFKELSQEKNINFTIKENVQFPFYLKGDINRLHQVLNNLLHNALKFTEKGSIALETTIEPFKDHKEVSVTFVIRDTGIGISSDQLSNLFIPFQQAEKHIARQYGGTGLGLSIVKELTKIMKGTIKVKSKLGKGTEIAIRLPFRLGRPLEKEKPTKLKTDKSEILNGFNILYVEDVESNQMLIKEYLEDFGAACDLASNSEEALTLTFVKKYQVILMDLQLPGTDGFEITETIKGQKNGKNKTTPVLALTAEPESASIASKLKIGRFKGIIHKPFDFGTFSQKIKNLTDPASSLPPPSFNLDFYKNAFKNNSEKLNYINSLLLQDFQRFESAVKEFQLRNDEAVFREEMHRIIPIIKNISYFSLIELLEQLRNTIAQRAPKQKLLEEIQLDLQRLITSLAALK